MPDSSPSAEAISAPADRQKNPPAVNLGSLMRQVPAGKANWGPKQAKEVEELTLLVLSALIREGQVFEVWFGSALSSGEEAQVNIFEASDPQRKDFPAMEEILRHVVNPSQYIGHKYIFAKGWQKPASGFSKLPKVICHNRVNFNELSAHTRLEARVRLLDLLGEADVDPQTSERLISEASQ